MAWSTGQLRLVGDEAAAAQVGSQRLRRLTEHGLLNGGKGGSGFDDAPLRGTRCEWLLVKGERTPGAEGSLVSLDPDEIIED
mmetsp:Transcript_15225/g.34976  ORF Transcript_15225/g.34976 Transcript_15225/m.34976 type:complete len:82 (+) Transcript_15225:438-683(+)